MPTECPPPGRRGCFHPVPDQLPPLSVDRVARYFGPEILKVGSGAPRSFARLIADNRRPCDRLLSIEPSRVLWEEFERSGSPGFPDHVTFENRGLFDLSARDAGLFDTVLKRFDDEVPLYQIHIDRRNQYSICRSAMVYFNRNLDDKSIYIILNDIYHYCFHFILYEYIFNYDIKFKFGKLYIHYSIYGASFLLGRGHALRFWT